MWIDLVLEVRRVDCRQCKVGKRERFKFKAEIPFCAKRVPIYLGKRRRASSIKEVAEELLLDWHTVKELGKCCMREQQWRIGTPGPKIIGIDEISISKRQAGHEYHVRFLADLGRACAEPQDWTLRYLPCIRA